MVGAPFPDSNISTLYDLFNYTNYVTSPVGGHYFGDVAVALVWIVAYGLVLGRGPIKALMASSFVAFVLATFLDLVGLVDANMLILPLSLMMVGIVVDKLMEHD